MGMEKRSVLFGSLIIAAGIFACGKQVANFRTGEGTGEPLSNSGNATGGAALGFTEVKALMDKSCNGAGCHSAPGAGGVPLETLADVKKYFDASLATVEVKKSMPIGKPKWTDDELTKLKAWKAAGFPETAAAAPAPATGTPTTAVKLSFAKDIKPFMDRSCAGTACHSTGATATAVVTDTVDGLSMDIDTSLMRAQDATAPMPPSTSTQPKLSAAELQKLKDWKAQNFPP